MSGNRFQSKICNLKSAIVIIPIALFFLLFWDIIECMGKKVLFFLLFLVVVTTFAFFVLSESALAQLPDVRDFIQILPGGKAENPGIWNPRSSAENPTIGAKLINPLRFDSLEELVTAILDIIVIVAAPIAALFLIYSGFLFVTARGSEDALKKAKSIFLWTIVGIAVLLGAEVLSRIIEGTIEQIKR